MPSTKQGTRRFGSFRRCGIPRGLCLGDSGMRFGETGGSLVGGLGNSPTFEGGVCDQGPSLGA